ncbi:MAG: EamA family transporter [Microbacterium sp.]
MLHVLAVLAAAVLFGTTGTSQALGPDGTTPLSVGAVRMVIGGTGLAVLAFALAGRHRRRHPSAGRPRAGIRPVLLMALTGLCLAVYQPLFFLGTARNGVAVSTVIALGSAPVLAGLLEWPLTRRLPSTTWMAATGLATVGVVLLGLGGASGSGGTDPLGVAGAIGAGASFAVFTNVQRRLLDAGWDAFTVVGGMGVSSALVSAAALPLIDASWIGQPRGLVMALWLGLATTAIAYVLFTWGLQRLSAATAATLTLGEPLTATLLGVTVLGERLSVAALAGVLVLAAGLALLARGASRARGSSPSPDSPASHHAPHESPAPTRERTGDSRADW